MSMNYKPACIVHGPWRLWQKTKVELRAGNKGKGKLLATGFYYQEQRNAVNLCNRDLSRFAEELGYRVTSIRTPHGVIQHEIIV